MRITWRSELSNTLVAAMEASWLSALMLAIGYGFAEPQVAMVGMRLFVLLYASRFLAGAIADASIGMERARLLVVYLAAATMFIVLKVQNYPGFAWLSASWLHQLTHDMTHLTPALGSVMLTVGLVVYTWLRALGMAAQRQRPASLFRHIQVGLLMVMGCALLAGRVGMAPLFLPWVVWFFFWGLLALAVTRLEDVARDRRSAVESYWLPIVLALAVLIVVTGGILSALYSRDTVDALARLLQPLASVIEVLITIIAFPIALLVELLVLILGPLLRPLLALAAQVLQELQAPGAGIDLGKLQQNQPFQVPASVLEMLKWLGILLTFAVIFLLLAFAFRRRQAEQESDADEVHESVWSLAELSAGLRALWRRLLSALGRNRQKLGARLAAPVTEEERAAFSIRQVYAHLLAEAARLGRPRPLAMTPYEYLGDLTALLPASRLDLSAITDAYVRCRYGAVGASPAELTTVQQAWLRIREEAGRVHAQRAAASHPAPQPVPIKAFTLPDALLKQAEKQKKRRWRR